jgi:hypothetical protein
LVILRAILDLAFDFEGVRRFLRFAGVRGLDPLAFFCSLGSLRFLDSGGLSGLGLCALVGAHFGRTGVFILERVGVGVSDDAPGLGCV